MLHIELHHIINYSLKTAFPVVLYSAHKYLLHIWISTKPSIQLNWFTLMTTMSQSTMQTQTSTQHKTSVCVKIQLLKQMLSYVSVQYAIDTVSC